MLLQDIILFLFFIILLITLSYPLGIYIYKIATKEKIFLTPVFQPVENLIYKIARINETEEQSWVKYSVNLCVFSLSCFLVTYFILIYQNSLPLNPQNFSSLPTDLSINTAISFITNTNWQAYSGESTLSYFSQMVGLVPLNFLAAAIGMSALFAIMRGFTGDKKTTLGHFEVDLIKICIYILFPLCFILALFYISQGVIQNFLPYTTVKTLEGGVQTIAQGPVASQIAIKMLGGNGGGFFAANAMHPFENPSAIVNFVQILSSMLIPSALVFTFGKLSQNMKHAYSIWITMAILLLGGIFFISYFEYLGNTIFNSKFHLASALNMEGKEMRFGIFSSSYFTAITTSMSLGANNAAFSSLIPASGAVALVNMLFNEVIFGGPGCGLYGMILYILLAVFLAGLMVGRTPEYLGKKIESFEISVAMVPLIGTCAVILILTSIACFSPIAISSIGNPGAHGFTEIFYAFTSATQNNGSSFASLNANNYFWNYLTAIAMFMGRYLNLICMIIIAGYMVKKKNREQNENTFPVHGPLFIILLIGVIVIFGALSYLPSLSLGPVLEHLQMLDGKIISAGAK